VGDLLLMLIVGMGSSRLVLPFLADGLGVEIRNGAPDIGRLMLLLSIQSLLLFGVIYLIAVRWRGVTWAELGFVAPSASWLSRAVLLALLCFPLVGTITWLQQQVTGQPFENPQFELLTPPSFAWGDYLATLLVAGVIAPIVEEIAFRGLLYRWLRERTGGALAMAISALAFSVLHGIPMLIPGIFVLGLILAWVYDRTRSIWIPILMHGVYNAVVTTALYMALAQGIGPAGQ
jgi:hypothetical protein